MSYLKRVFYSSLVVLIGLVFFNGCSKSGDGTGGGGGGPNPNPVAPTLTIIPGTAITISYNDNASFSWVTNGTSVTVDGVPYSTSSFTSPDLHANTTYSVTARSANGLTTTVQVVITVLSTGVDVYAAGYDNSFIVYWKNGTQVPLAPIPSPSGDGTGMVLAGTDTYVSGYINGTASYWKNTTRINLSTPASGYCEANAIQVSGPDVYVAGTDGAGSGNYAVYWKNGTRVELQASNQLTNAYAIAVSGGNVHVAGYVGDSAVYWKNGVRTTLSNGYARAYGMTVSGTDVYIAGTENGNAVYWKNGVKTVLPGIQVSVANTIVISGSDIYVAGREDFKAVYWKNGVKTSLSSEYSEITSVCVYGTTVYMAGFISTATSSSAVYWKNGIMTTIAAGNGLGFKKPKAIVVVQR